MPELPEVEVTRLSFAQAIQGASIIAASAGKPLRWALGCDAGSLVGRQVLGVGRRGKYLLIELDQGWLLVHLGMSGSLRFARELPPGGIHDHFEMVTTQGVLRLNDPRRFGCVVYVSRLEDAQAVKLLGKLGMEPLTEAFDLKLFAAGLHQRKAAIKQVLLAGDLVVGVGNIYASEALFMAAIRPTLSADALSKPQVARLHAAIKNVLTRAVQKGGSTLKDFSSASGQTGYFQLEAMVYGRANLPCKQCGNYIKMIRQGQRATFYCPICQKR
ncbi:MAG: formamidopyrimidine-DNA glycosylase [Comamonadaceae bacterium]|nr:MAG: formamidopyrimidine-DNA glycosylase [Comamonadaceae bacterium]